VVCSFWVHLVLVAGVCLAYNWAIAHYELELARKSGEFSPYAAPLYARVAWYEPSGHLAEMPKVMEWQDYLPPALMYLIGAGTDPDFHLQFPQWTWWPIGVAAVWAALVVAQIRWLRVSAWLWVLVCVGFVLILNVTVNSMQGGPNVLAQPFARVDMEYFGDVGKVESMGEFWRDYPELNRQHAITHHAGTHPPGGVTFLWWVVQKFGEEGTCGTFNSLWAASWAAILASALAVVPVYLLARRLYGEKVGVIAAGLYALTPNLVLFGATCMDGVFAVLPVVAIWLFHKAIKDRPIVYGVLFGLALAGGLLMTFAALCVGIITTVYGVVALIVDRKSFWRILLVNVIGVVMIVAVHWGLYKWVGYDVLEAIDAARQRNRNVMGTGLETWGRYFDIGFADLFAFLIGSGIVATTLWLRQFGRAIGEGFKKGEWDLFAISFLPALLVISFANLFTFEVERIWMFMTPFVIVAGAANVMSAWKAGKIRWGVLGPAMVLLFAQTFLTQLFLFTYW